METIPMNGKIFVLSYAAAVPPLTEDENSELETSIREGGVIAPVIVDKDNNVIDGAHRMRIASGLGLRRVPIKTLSDLTPDQKLRMAVELNVYRRHLSNRQKQKLVEEILMQNPSLSDRKIAKTAGVDHKSVGKVRAKLASSGEIPHDASCRGGRGRDQPANKSPEDVPCAPDDAGDPPQDDLIWQSAVTDVAAHLAGLAEWCTDTIAHALSDQTENVLLEVVAELRKFADTIESKFLAHIAAPGPEDDFDASDDGNDGPPDEELTQPDDFEDFVQED